MSQNKCALSICEIIPQILKRNSLVECFAFNDEQQFHAGCSGAKLLTIQSIFKDGNSQKSLNARLGKYSGFFRISSFCFSEDSVTPAVR